MPFCEDANGAEQDGISQMEATVGGGVRSSTARAYLHPAKQRANLSIQTDALAHRIEVHQGRAVGVHYRQRGQLCEARAAREIIVCGGAFNSPQLLLLSGIGPADELRALGIEPVHDLPGVGRNLVDHPNILNEYELVGGQGLTRHLRVDRAALAVARWKLTRGGPFALTGTSANVFARTLPGLDQPDIQMMTLPISNNAELWGPGFGRRPPFRLAVRTGYLQPKSRGWVKLRSANPADPPRILLNMFDDPRDLDAMVRAIRFSRSMYAQQPLRDLIRSEVLPGSGHRRRRGAEGAHSPQRGAPLASRRHLQDGPRCAGRGR